MHQCRDNIPCVCLGSGGTTHHVTHVELAATSCHLAMNLERSAFAVTPRMPPAWHGAGRRGIQGPPKAWADTQARRDTTGSHCLRGLIRLFCLSTQK